MKKISVIVFITFVGLAACKSGADTAAEQDSLRHADSLNKSVDSASKKLEKMMDTASNEVKMMGDTSVKMK